MRVPLVYLPCCPVLNCLGKQGELSGNCSPDLTVRFILSPSHVGQGRLLRQGLQCQRVSLRWGRLPRPQPQDGVWKPGKQGVVKVVSESWANLLKAVRLIDLLPQDDDHAFNWQDSNHVSDWGGEIHDSCNQNCLDNWLADGFCDATCNVQECAFDSGMYVYSCHEAQWPMTIDRNSHYVNTDFKR